MEKQYGDSMKGEQTARESERRRDKTVRLRGNKTDREGEEETERTDMDGCNEIMSV